MNFLYNAARAVELQNPLSSAGIETLDQLLTKVSEAAIIIAFPIVTAVIIYGAFQILIGGTDPKKVSDGKDIIKYALIGLVIAIAATGIVSLVANLLGAKTSSREPQAPYNSGSDSNLRGDEGRFYIQPHTLPLPTTPDTSGGGGGGGGKKLLDPRSTQ